MVMMSVSCEVLYILGGGVDSQKLSLVWHVQYMMMVLYIMPGECRARSTVKEHGGPLSGILSVDVDVP